MSSLGQTFTLGAQIAERRVLVAAIERFCAELGDRARALRDKMITAAGEAFNNLVLHGYGGAAGRVGVTIDVVGRELWVSLRDDARPFDPTRVPIEDPGVDAEGGWGLFLMTHLADRIVYEAGPPNALAIAMSFPE